MKSTTVVFKDNAWEENFNPEWDKKNNVIIFFGNKEEALNPVVDFFKEATVIGGQSSGNICGDKCMPADSTAVLSILEFDKTQNYMAVEEFKNYEESYTVGQRLMNRLNEKSTELGEKLSGVLVISEGLVINGNKLAEGMASLNADKAPVIGGLAADDLGFEETFIVTKQGFIGNSVAALGFYGDKFVMINASHSGVTSFGPEKTATKADKNVLYELDGEQALDVYERYLGEEASKNLPSSGLQFPVEVSKDGLNHGLLRTPIDINREDGSITFTGEIPEGSEIKLMFAAPNDLIDASEEVADSCFSRIPKNIKDNKKYFSLLISCAGRKLVMDQRWSEEVCVPAEYIDEELKAVKDHQIGFYSYGEIVDFDGKVSLVNQTLSEGIIYEEE